MIYLNCVSPAVIGIINIDRGCYQLRMRGFVIRHGYIPEDYIPAAFKRSIAWCHIYDSVIPLRCILFPIRNIVIDPDIINRIVILL